MSHTFMDFAKVDLGHKSLLNEFFHLDSTTVAKYGIESEYLTPLYRKDDLVDSAYLQTGKPSVQLFQCNKGTADLRGTGAGRYIAWAERQVIQRSKKQAAATSKWSEALAKQSGKYWYSPKAQAIYGKIALRKGIGKYYAPYVFSKPVALDQRLYIIAPLNGVNENVLIAYLCSSLFALSLEVNADMALGDGVLTLGTKSLRNVPCVDLRAISANSKAARDIAGVLRSLLASTPPPYQSFVTNKEIRQIDELLEAIGLDPVRAVDCESELERLASARHSLAEKRKTFKATSEDVNVGSVAEGLLLRLRPWLEARRFPEDHLQSDHAHQMRLPAGPLVVETAPLLDTCDVKVLDSQQHLVYHNTLPITVAELLLRCLQWGRRDFQLTQSPTGAHNALTKFQELVAGFETEYSAAIGDVSIGQRYAAELRARVLAGLGLDSTLALPFDASNRWAVGAS